VPLRFRWCVVLLWRTFFLFSHSSLLPPFVQEPVSCFLTYPPSPPPKSDELPVFPFPLPWATCFERMVSRLDRLAAKTPLDEKRKLSSQKLRTLPSTPAPSAQQANSARPNDPMSLLSALRLVLLHCAPVFSQDPQISSFPPQKRPIPVTLVSFCCPKTPYFFFSHPRRFSAQPHPFADPLPPPPDLLPFFRLVA